MTKQERTFHGGDLNKATSLFELGLLVRYVPNAKSWQCVYKNGINRYSYGWISEIALNEIFTKDWGKKHLESFMSNCCSYWDEWVMFPMQRRIDDFIAYFGNLELFGEDYSGGCTAKEICRKLHLKFDIDYEQA